MDLVGHFNYWVAIALMMAGFYAVIAGGNLLKKLVGLNIFQTAVFLLYITIANVRGGTAPIAKAGFAPDEYANPLPHVLILTAIVVLVATTALGLALVVRIKEAYGSVEEDEILKRDEE